MDDQIASAIDRLPPGLVDEILKDAEELSGVPKSDLEIVRADEVTWPDGSLGCPEPGFSYTQALVEGYDIDVRAGEILLDYRATSGGNFRLCPGLSVPDPPDK